MTRTDNSKLAFVASESEEAASASESLCARYGCVSTAEADVIVALGGDGFMLQTLRENMSAGKPIYGMNRGTVGFLMNEYNEDGLVERIAAADAAKIRPLSMEARTTDGRTVTALAINEVSLFRQSYQAAKLSITVDGHPRMEELICDGILVATPAGSTAYNLSAQGPILPLQARLLALTPVSPFRPRRWHGALLPHTAEVRFDVREIRKRPVNAVADNIEVKSVVSVTVKESPRARVTVLFDASHSWDDRILLEQFRY
ncbi:NAD kinase [Tianweitania populi]|uniref:NAD kinase n=1 Tax=Tianweitania populi TaxID=1607949 RepID=A0A8J3DUE9_9HYPH|nr:NAD kinase [Tianweitania populi]GHD08117.1 NAD kinase [Tianweitania populi]